MRTATCAECGVVFSYATPGRPALTCSEPCREQRRREQGRRRSQRWALRVAVRHLQDDAALEGAEVAP